MFIFTTFLPTFAWFWDILNHWNMSGQIRAQCWPCFANVGCGFCHFDHFQYQAGHILALICLYFGHVLFCFDSFWLIITNILPILAKFKPVLIFMWNNFQRIILYKFWLFGKTLLPMKTPRNAVLFLEKLINYSFEKKCLNKSF